ncbi:rCG40937, partial [Rattus norvegicus]
QRSWATFHL